MATATISPDTGTSGDATSNSVSWSSLSNLPTCDNSYVVSGRMGGDLVQTAILAAEDYDVTAINNSGLITGLEVHIEALIDGGGAEFTEVFLRRNNARTGDNKAATPVALSTSETDHQFGGVGDVWNSSYRTVGDFQGSGNGVEIRVTRVSGTLIVSIDCMTLICYFDEQRPFIMRFALAPLKPTLQRHRH